MKTALMKKQRAIKGDEEGDVSSPSSSDDDRVSMAPLSGQALKEFALHRHLGAHPHLVDMKGIVVDQSHTYIPKLVMEYYPHTLDTLIYSPGEFFFHSVEQAQRTRRRIGLEMLQGLQRMHRRSVLHNDLKPTNILLTSTLSARIADIGMSQYHTPSVPKTGSAYTLPYRAPEILFGDTLYNESVDLWAFACIMLEWLSAWGSARLVGTSGTRGHFNPTHLAFYEPTLCRHDNPDRIQIYLLFHELGVPTWSGWTQYPDAPTVYPQFTTPALTPYTFAARKNCTIQRPCLRELELLFRCLQYDPSCRPTLDEFCDAWMALDPVVSKIPPVVPPKMPQPLSLFTRMCSFTPTMQRPSLWIDIHLAGLPIALVGSDDEAGLYMRSCVQIWRDMTKLAVYGWKTAQCMFLQACVRRRIATGKRIEINELRRFEIRAIQVATRVLGDEWIAVANEEHTKQKCLQFLHLIQWDVSLYPDPEGGFEWEAIRPC